MSEVALHSLQAHQSSGAKEPKDSSHDKENDRSRAAAPRGEGAARGVKAGTFEVCLKGEWRQYYVKVSDKALQASACMSAPARARRSGALWTRRVRLVRKEGRDVSS